MALASDKTSAKSALQMNIQYIKGYPFPGGPRFTEKNILSALNYRPLDSDLIISSYPKTGTTWMEYIILQILHRSKLFPSMVELNHKMVPYMERVGSSVVESVEPPTPRFMKYHVPYHMIPYNKSAKYIYIIRNPKDVIVSYYHFRRNMGYEDVPFDHFFDCFMSGEIPYGDYIHHVKSWYDHKDDANLLLLCYEKVHADVKGGILRIAKYLGEEHYKAVVEDEELVDEIIAKTSFDNMSKNLVVTPVHVDVSLDPGQNVADAKSVKFFRKGVPRDWVNHLSEKQTRLIDNKMLEVFGEGELYDLWK